MTAADWDICSYPGTMLAHLRTGSARKLRLFVCASIRHIWLLLPDPRSRQAVEDSELWADGRLSAKDLLQTRAMAWQAETECGQLVKARGTGRFPLCVFDVAQPSGRERETAWHRLRRTSPSNEPTRLTFPLTGKHSVFEVVVPGRVLEQPEWGEVAMLFSYPNVWNTCLLILRKRGYRLLLTGDPDEVNSIARCTWNAEKDGIKLRGNNPIELLGLAGIHEYHQPAKDLPYWWRIEGDNIIAELEVEWRHRANVEPTWTVYRQDDNGNRFVVSTRLSREEAERLVAEFEARGHKQVYWAEPALT